MFRVKYIMSIWRPSRTTTTLYYNAVQHVATQLNNIRVQPQGVIPRGRLHRTNTE